MNIQFLQFLRIFVCLVLLAACSHSRGEFVLINKTRDVIKLAHVEICHDAFDMENIGPGETRNGIFYVRGDSHYEVIIDFANGKRLSRELGYVTDGFNFKDTLEVSETDILFYGHTVQKPPETSGSKTSKTSGSGLVTSNLGVRS